MESPQNRDCDDLTAHASAVDEELAVKPLQAGQRLKNLRLMHDTYHQLYWQSADSLSKVWTLYLAIAATLVGYVLTKGTAPDLVPGFLVGAIAVTIVSVMVFGAWAWGLRRIIKILESITKELDISLYEDLQFQRLFRDWDRLLVFIIIGTVAIGGFFAAVLMFLF